jgi:C-terminal processing protease CtpA/Prc
MSGSRIILVAGAALLSGLFGSGYWYAHSQLAAAAASATSTPDVADAFVRFDMEVYDIIQENYWQKASDADMAQLFRAALAQVAADPTAALAVPDRTGTERMLAIAFERAGTSTRKELAVNLAIAVLTTLSPQGRSGLLTDAQETQFRDHVANVDRSHDLYQDLGAPQGASQQEVSAAFSKREAELAASSSPEAKKALEQARYAKQVLIATTTKALYDEAKIEPSLKSAMPDVHTLYLDLRQITPGSFAEFQQTVAALPADSPVSGIIIDLRGNIGGTLDFARYLLGLFVGPNQYAFDLFHKGELALNRTPAEVPAIPALARMEHVALLVNGMTQSTAELTASIFERQRLGIIVGERTRGWGTVENTYPIKTDLGDGVHYAVLLVHSATIRPDGQSIENLGITPDVDTTAHDWRARLLEKTHSAAFSRAVEKELAK